MSNRLSVLFPGVATYYVSDVGNDANDGFWPTSPWKSLERANQVTLNPGDRLLFEGGKTFTGSLRLNSVVGRPDQPIVIGSYGTGWATITSPSAPAIKGYNCGYLEVRNLILKGGGSNRWVTFFSDTPGLSHLYLSLLDVSSFAVGINVQSSVASFSDVRITWVTVHDNANTGLYLGGVHRGDLTGFYVGQCEAYNHPGERGYGFYIFNAKNGLVERSVAHDNGAYSAMPQGFSVQESDGVTVRHCEAYRTSTASGRDGNGFIIDGGCTNCVIEYCYAHDNYGAGFQMTQYANAGAQFAGNEVRYNLAVDNGFGLAAYGEAPEGAMADSRAYANTVYADVSRVARPLGQVYLLGFFRNWAGYNNLVVVKGDVPLVEAWTDSPALSVVLAGNGYWASGAAPEFEYEGVTYNDLGSWRGRTGWEALQGVPTGKVADPLWESTPDLGLTLGTARIEALGSSLSAWRLQAASPLVNAGIDLKGVGINPPSVDLFGNGVPQGAGYDVGACESG